SFGDGGSFAVPVDGVPAADPVQAMVDDYAARIADTPAARDAIRRIVVGATENVEPDTLPPDVVAAYRQLNLAADLGIGGGRAGRRPVRVRPGGGVPVAARGRPELRAVQRRGHLRRAADAVVLADEGPRPVVRGADRGEVPGADDAGGAAEPALPPDGPQLR